MAALRQSALQKHHRAAQDLKFYAEHQREAAAAVLQRHSRRRHSTPVAAAEAISRDARICAAQPHKKKELELAAVLMDDASDSDDDNSGGFDFETEMAQESATPNFQELFPDKSHPSSPPPHL